MKRLIYIPFFLISFFGYSQENDSTETIKRFAIGLNYSIDQTYRTLKNTANDSFYKGVEDSRNSREEPSINFSFGIRGGYYLNKNVQLEAGCSYIKLGYQTKESILTSSDLNDPRRGFSVESTNLPKSERLDIDQNYLSIPLGVKAFLFRNRIRAFVSGGILTNVFLSRVATYKWTLSDGTVESVTTTNETLSKINMGLFFELGIDFLLSEHLNIQVGPKYQKSITSIIDRNIKEYPYSYGLGIGIYYSF